MSQKTPKSAVPPQPARPVIVRVAGMRRTGTCRYMDFGMNISAISRIVAGGVAGGAASY